MSAADGSVQWQLTPADSSPYALMECAGPPLFDSGGNTYVGGYPKGQYPGPSSPTGWNLVSYSRTGALRWATPIESFQLNFILPDDVIGADGNVYAYIDGYVHGTPSYLHAYRASDGASLWSTEIPPGMSPGIGLYADQSGLIIGGTMRFDYQGHMLQTPGQSARGTRASPMAQEPGGAVYTASTNKTHCTDKKPYYKVTVARWTLKGQDWKREIRPSAPPASREECEGSIHIAAISSVPGGGVVVTFENRNNTASYEHVLFRLNAMGKVLWTHPVQHGWASPSSAGGVRVTSDGTVVTVEDGREACTFNRWGECGVVAVDFVNAATGATSRPTVLVRTTVPAYWSEPPNEPRVSGEFAIGPDSVYLDLALNQEYQVVKLDEPGLGADYREALRPTYKPSAPNSYVALGDSYSSGEGNAPYETSSDKRTEPPDLCHRSLSAYGPLVATALADPLTFVACSGAVTNDLFASSSNNISEPAQLSAVDANTKVVTLTIGGNDGGFPLLLEQCVDMQRFHPGFGCSANTSLANVTDNRLAALDGKRDATTPTSEPIHSILSVLDAIHTKASGAHIYIGLYPELFGSSKSRYPIVLGAPSGRACEVGSFGGDGLHIDYSDAQWLNGLGKQLNSIITKAAKAAGPFVSVVKARFNGHGLCDSGELWFYPVEVEVQHPDEWDMTWVPMVGSFHPTVIGQANGYAAAFEAKIK